ncbi:DEAD/DEAH box helicase, partial [Thermodesulfobacteriota bacterium]
MKFKPYLHQEQAFKRLSGTRPDSTIVATGTGSGKTECYLYPILNHCYQRRGEHGIKAVIIYPMNALATDQAERLAKIISNNPKLKGHVTAGLFVGQKEKDPHRSMGADYIITDKETQRLKPPDILLTNYKMLDYLLIRPKDYPLWKLNNPETLQYLVVDELHTFDGAQGTDLACLIRRLKARLSTPEGFLCCVGTSATLGTEDERSELREYAEKIFGEAFEEDCMIKESVLNVDEFLAREPVSRLELVSPNQANELNPQIYKDYPDFIRAQHELWFDEIIPEAQWEDRAWRIELSKKLKGHRFLRNLLTALGGQIRSYSEVLTWLNSAYVGLAGSDSTYQVNLLTSFLALISEARIWKVAEGDEGLDPSSLGSPTATAPFLNVRVQYWLRELRRMIGEVRNPPRLRFADDLTEEQKQNHLPVVHCRECGSMGWAGTKRQQDTIINSHLQTFYVSFFAFSPNVVFIFPEERDLSEQGLDGESFHICGSCLNLTRTEKPQECPSCGSRELVRVFCPNSRLKRKNRFVGIHNCPYCGGFNSLTVIGSRAASLASVLIAQLYSSSFNDDKKLLTFSDSVQDAAHRAGFFASRTYRFNFRTALQRFVQAEGKGLSLVDLPKAFIQYWSDRMDSNAYIATFLAPNMEWLADYHHMTTFGNLPKDSKLRYEVDQRIGWEICSEYGFNTRIGRTLEKTGSSILHVDPDKLEAVVNRLLEPFQNEFGQLRDLDATTLRRFVLGILVHLKNQGGVIHHALEGYISSKGNAYGISKQHRWMPHFGSRARAPVFLTTRPATRFDQIPTATSRSRTWHHDWAEKCFMPIHVLISESISAIYQLTLKALEEEGLLGQRQVQSDKVWGLTPETLIAGNQVAQFRCKDCGHSLSISDQETDLWDGAPCLRFRCNGQYKGLETRRDYYRELYASGDIQRIFAEKHTGLLDRDNREELEKRFKSRDLDRRPWDPNLLSCTPTLEMGIDIGDLSSVILCSVPPAQANYLQRIGRSGRTDGNALNLTLANGRPHDLFFFAEPKEMLAGRVEAPGVFLNASAVLERQLTAFCFDRWVESGISENALPNELGPVLSKLDPVDEKRFPHNFLFFISNNQTELLDSFLAVFEDRLSESSKSHIKEFVEGDEDTGGGLQYRIMAGLHARKEDIESLRKKVQTLTKRIRAKEKDPARGKHYEDEIAELKLEKEGLQTVIKRIRDQNIFNFFTDEGLIPNYAFPEAGVILRSIIYRKKERPDDGGSKYDTWTEEYQRAAASAIDELAPENSFYAGGRRVRIDQVDMTLSQVEVWRLCDNCSYTELLGIEKEKSLCPRCGSPMWSDEGRKRPMLRMRQVFATSSDRESRIADDSDDREPSFFNKQMLVDFHDHHITQAYRVDSDELPFGFEFLSKATFREINFGEKGEGGPTFTIAGVDLPRKGFPVCRHCGKVQNHKGQIQHALTCTSRNQESDKNFTDCVYLYREFSSEAIRILLPVTTFSGSDQKLHSFIAALQLGLRLYFRGRIDHLRTTVFEEPIPDSTIRKKYLLLFDTVPGGTGYLKDLMRSKDPLLEVLGKAHKALGSCSCTKEPDKDGCYRCLYAYRTSYNMEETSRDTALNLLSEILRYRENFVKTESLKKIPVDVLIGSELEARFVESLRRLRNDGHQVSLKKALVNNKPGYFFRINYRAYDIEPQVKLSGGDGVTVPSRADFVFWPVRPKDAAKPIVVFTDGFFYHKNRIGLDMAQRMAIVKSNKFHVWSLTWKDVENRFKPQGQYFRNYIDPTKTPGGPTLKKLVAGWKLNDFKKTHSEDSYRWFVRFLLNPDKASWASYAFAASLTLLDTERFTADEAVESWRNDLSTLLTEGMEDEISELDGPLLHGLYEPKEDVAIAPVRLFTMAQKLAVQNKDPSGAAVICSFMDSDVNKEKKDFESTWTGYLRLYNLFQFLPRAIFVTHKGLAERTYDNLVAKKKVEEPDREQGLTAEWTELKELTDPGVHLLLDVLAEAGLPLPEAGFELANEQSIVQA